MYGGAQAFNVLRYGFDLEALYLRLDPAESPARSAEVASHLKVSVIAPEAQSWVEFEAVPDGRVRTGWRQGQQAGHVAFLDIVEIRIPFRALEVAAGAKVALCVHSLRDEVEVERLPRYGFVTLTVPDRDFERLNWRV